MKKYETPNVEVTKFVTEDVITTSTIIPCENQSDKG